MDKKRLGINMIHLKPNYQNIDKKIFYGITEISLLVSS